MATSHSSMTFHSVAYITKPLYTNLFQATPTTNKTIQDRFMISFEIHNDGTKDDLKLPTDDSLLTLTAFEEGKDVVVYVMSSMGEEQICAVKEVGGGIIIEIIVYVELIKPSLPVHTLDSPMTFFHAPGSVWGFNLRVLSRNIEFSAPLTASLIVVHSRTAKFLLSLKIQIRQRIFRINKLLSYNTSYVHLKLRWRRFEPSLCMWLPLQDKNGLLHKE
ncbi:unnamed protein product [Arabis nemorensis]|uniref:Translation initiation factor 5A C-terminal domain-containing protein n=1 Tax=Arabis nemorensis TaxID=586526 RepID=A0A565BD65_9BRAS|nr:unnamed protein product [Arabis nemorensis]